jgi:hypothetical protein
MSCRLVRARRAERAAHDGSRAGAPTPLEARARARRGDRIGVGSEAYYGQARYVTGPSRTPGQGLRRMGDTAAPRRWMARLGRPPQTVPAGRRGPRCGWSPRAAYGALDASGTSDIAGTRASFRTPGDGRAQADRMWTHRSRSRFRGSLGVQLARAQQSTCAHAGGRGQIAVLRGGAGGSDGGTGPR